MTGDHRPQAGSLSAHQTRRRAVQTFTAVAGSLLVAGTGMGAVDPSARAQDDRDEDDSGRGRDRGRGRGGDDHDNSGPGNEEDRALIEAAEIPPSSIEVRIVSDDTGGFVPGDLTVDLGQSVTFLNAHSDDHTATGSGFDTGIIPTGGIATVVLDEPGRFAYACMIHPEMTGTISVRGADGVVPQRQAQAAAAPADAIPVRIVNLAFDPSALTVPTGSTVLWSNNDSVPHTVTSLDGLFDSGIFDPGATFSFTFNEPGSFVYQCQLHPSMQGSIAAEGNPVPGAQSAAPAEEQAAVPAEPATQAAQEGEDAVSIVDFAFEPASLEIAAGATVVWTNKGQAPHTVTGDFADSGILEPGQTFSHTFPQAGAFAYACALHPRMTGQISVGEGEAAGTPAGAETSTASGEGLWVIALAPDPQTPLSAHQGLVTLHTDGSATANFASLAEDVPSAVTLDSGHGSWSADDDGLGIALLALLLDSERRFAGTATITIQAQISPDGNALDGTFAISPFTEVEDLRGEGGVRGELAQIVS